MYGINSDFQKRNVAIYARVSTEHEAQLSALENQMDWYKPILSARPDWMLTKQYVDEGITGTSAEKRPRFMEMIRDAKAQKFDMIITREVSGITALRCSSSTTTSRPLTVTGSCG